MNIASHGIHLEDARIYWLAGWFMEIAMCSGRALGLRCKPRN